MKINTILSAFLVLILFSACSQKDNFTIGNSQNPMAIQYTKKRDIIKNGMPKVMFFATYLNKIDKKYDNDKLNSFIIGIHITDQKNHDLIENRFELFLNDKKPLSLVEISNDSNFVKSIPLKNNWANYYLVHFENEKDVYDLNLVLTHPVYGNLAVTFRK